jgi:protein-S-isoprenylcysteine O-methyltransferase Ste14
MAISLCAGCWVEARGSGAVASALVNVFSVPAGPAGDWRARVLAVVFAIFGSPIIIYALTHPALLRRRLRSGPGFERDTSQKIIMTLLPVCLAALFVVIALDIRHGWSSVPTAVALAGDVLVAAGLLLVLLTFSANQFAAATVQVEAGQTVISTGPYARIRHPMYSGLLLLFAGASLAIGSWWGLAVFPPLLALFIWRLLNEERYLSSHLPGYKEYRERVTRRLIPGVW